MPTAETENEFICEEKIRKLPKNSTLLIITGPSPNILNENWVDLVDYNDKDNIKNIIINNCKLSLKKGNPNLEEFDDFRSLQYLRLDQLNLPSFNWIWVVNLNRLVTLILDNNPIERLDGDAEISLQHLSLKNCSLTTLPQKENQILDIMKELKTLNITGPYFTSSHEEVCTKLEKLEKFNGNPCLRQTPKETTSSGNELESPKETRSSGNKLQSLSTILLLGLFLLLANGNGRHFGKWWILLFMVGIPLSRGVMLFDPEKSINETDLNLESRGIEALEDDDFISLPNLTHLYLSNNSLERLNVYSESITYLEVNNNLIQEIEGEDFNGLPQLQKLFLERNKLTKIDWDLSKKLPNLKRVDLSYNSDLRTVHIKSSSLEKLYLTNNTIDKLILETPRLRLIDFRFAKYNGDGLEEICRRHSRFTFRITYEPENSSTTADYQCTALENIPVVKALNFEAIIQEKEVKAEVHQEVELEAEVEVVEKEEEDVKVVGCEYSTLRANIGDVVISLDGYYKLNVIFASLCMCVVAMSLSLLWLTLKVRRIVYAEKDSTKFRLVSDGTA